ncbi:MAG: hypothetical protein GF346_09115 [Candidatus Eisenbacteria bacterium]|nr:hypothetical protein [Candidatus Eisenbacteria bacterium]
MNLSTKNGAPRFEAAPERRPPTPDLPLEGLIALCHRRWALPVLAELARAKGERSVVLRHRLGAPPSALRLTLDELIAAGRVLPNPGYGHPLRPEYVLAGTAEALGRSALILWDLIRTRRLETTAGRKWSLPILAAVGRRPTRFHVLRSRLEPVTDRALVLRLKGLQRAGLIERSVRDTGPPAAAYRTTDRAAFLLEPIRRVARAAKAPR